MSAFSAAIVSAMSRVAMPAGCAGRRAGASGNARARIGGVGDEAEGCGGVSEGQVGGCRLTEEKQGATRGEADFGGAECEGALREADDLVRRHAAIG